MELESQSVCVESELELVEWKAADSERDQNWFEWNRNCMELNKMLFHYSIWCFKSKVKCIQLKLYVEKTRKSSLPDIKTTKWLVTPKCTS